MRQSSPIERAVEAASSIAGERSAAAVGHVEDVRLRNYDGRSSHEVAVTLRRDGGVVFERSFDLPPGAAASEVDAVDAGRYDVQVEVDGRAGELDGCRIDEWPENTVLVEVGNGAVSVTTVGR